MKVAVVTVRASSGEQGGAERLFDALVQSFLDLGHEAEEVCLYTDESTYERILENYLHFHDLDLSSFDLVVSTKAPTWMVRHVSCCCCAYSPTRTLMQGRTCLELRSHM